MADKKPSAIHYGLSTNCRASELLVWRNCCQSVYYHTQTRGSLSLSNWIWKQVLFWSCVGVMHALFLSPHDEANRTPTALSHYQRAVAISPKDVLMIYTLNKKTCNMCKWQFLSSQYQMLNRLNLLSWFYRIRPSVAHQPMKECHMNDKIMM